MTSHFPCSRRVATLLAATLALGATATAAAPGVIRIQRGDTLSELARRHGTTVAALRELNGLGGNNLIVAGRTLRVSRVPAVRAPRATGGRWVEAVHTVRPGDTLIRIARRYDQAPAGIARRNRLPKSLVVRVGQRLVVGSRRVAPAAAAAPRAAVRRGTPPSISRARARALVVRQARQHRVDPSLALALAWQESGLQQDIVSSVGAVGIMQVMPSTGDWVSRYLARRPLDLHDPADNVEAGVRYLAQLLRVAGSTDRALAGYYQGLRSVSTRGMYDDTKQYVRNIAALRRRLAGRQP